MKRYQEIALYDREESILRIPNGYVLHPRGRFAKLQRWLWDKARRSGLLVQSFDDKVEYRRIAIEPHRILTDKVMAAIDTVYRFGHTPSEILMGPETLRELINEPLLRNTDAFSVRLGDAHTNRELFGLTLHVLPWMEGMLVR